VIKKIAIDEFVRHVGRYPVLDVRSPGEYRHAHIPGAHNLPLFSDEERKVVGTLYKQEGRQLAIKAGLDYFGPKMSKMVEAVEAIVNIHLPQNQIPNSQFPIPDSNHLIPNSKFQIPTTQYPIPQKVLLHCWRGGMRSAGVAWLLDLYGFEVYTLNGGYKSFRNWALGQFEKPYSFAILGGYTGAGKTQVLKALAKADQPIIDLEGLACHKGSAFGALGETKRPSQEMFENSLAANLFTISNKLSEAIWLEDESQRIGLVNLPGALWKTMRQSPLYFLDVPFEERLNYITGEYGKYKKEELVNAIIRIQKRLGGVNTKNAINFLLENNYKESFRILLTYYDKYYERGLRETDADKRQIITLTCDEVDPKINSKKLLQNQTKDGITDERN
jgi:tRNA 2-selenouridine synthase